MSEENTGYHPADSNGDGVVTPEEHQMYIEFKRKELEDKDAQRDAIRKMAWFSLFGLLLYPFGIFCTSFLTFRELRSFSSFLQSIFFSFFATRIAG